MESFGYKFYGRKFSRPLKENDKRILEGHVNILSLSELGVFVQMCRGKRVCLEIGFGDGVHMVARALKDPETIILGCDPFMNGVVKVLKNIDANNVQNIFIFPDDARYVLDEMSSGFISEVYILFPDPWHKSRHHKRRIINAESVKKFENLLTAEGKVFVATDDVNYKDWILDHFSDSAGFGLFHGEGDDIYNRPDGWHQTRYEKKAILSGKRCHYMTFRKPTSVE